MARTAKALNAFIHGVSSEDSDPTDQSVLQDMLLDYCPDSVHHDSKDNSDIESDCSDINPSTYDGLTNR